MYTFTFITHPKPTHPRYGDLDGAYATVFVNEPVADSAETAARGLVEEAGWDIEELDDWAPVGDDEYRPGMAWYLYYVQAKRDGICAVFNTWPVGAPDADIE